MYAMEDLEYYTEQAINDLKKGCAPFRVGTVVKVGDDLYLLKRVGTWDEILNAKCHKFIKLYGDIRTIVQTLIIKGNGYKDDRGTFGNNGLLYRADAIRLMEMGVVMTHERYYKVRFKMCDGKMYDHWDDKDEPDMWYDFDYSNYNDGEHTLGNDEYVGWKVWVDDN